MEPAELNGSASVRPTAMVCPDAPASTPQENLPVEESQRSLLVPVQAVRPEPKVFDADAYPPTSKFEETEARPVIFVRPEVGAMVRPASEPMVPALRMSASSVAEMDAVVSVLCPPTVRFPPVTRDAAVTLVPTVRDLAMFREPEKELEPVFTEVRMPARVRVPEIDAVPPTSNRVSVAPPALIPRLPVVISKPVEEEAPPLNVCNPVKVLAPKIARVPVVGRVTVVMPVTVKVVPKLPEMVTVEAALFAMPVPPKAGPITAPFQVPVVMTPVLGVMTRPL